MDLYDVEGMAKSLEQEVCPAIVKLIVRASLTDPALVALTHQAQYGKAFTFSYSPAGQPLMYWFPEKHRGDPDPSFDQVKLVVYLAERSSDLMVAGVE